MTAEDDKVFTPSSIPVLMYHSIQPKGKSNLVIDPAEFDKQMRWLKNNGYESITMRELSNLLATGRSQVSRPFVITFDDSYEDVFKQAYPILRRYDFKATVFLVTKTINTPNHLRTSQMNAMKSANFDFQSHTEHHVDLRTLSYEAQVRELARSKLIIENLNHEPFIAVSYPAGKYNSMTLKAVRLFKTSKKRSCRL